MANTLTPININIGCIETIFLSRNHFLVGININIGCIETIMIFR